MHRMVVLAACGFLASCAQSQDPAPSVQRPAPKPSPQAAPQVQPPGSGAGFRAPKVMTVPGLEGVIGRSARALEVNFGAPALRVREGDATKLQWRGQTCVLDVYFYPLTKGAEPTATFLATRRASDGQEVERLACVNSLMKR